MFLLLKSDGQLQNVGLCVATGLQSGRSQSKCLIEIFAQIAGEKLAFVIGGEGTEWNRQAVKGLPYQFYILHPQSAGVDMCVLSR